MKKFYFLLVSLVLMVTTANAQVSALTDLLGKYQFTATVEFTADATNEYKAALSNSCEVVIDVDASGDVVLTGLAGASSGQTVTAIDTELNQIKILNPNPNGNSLWGNGLVLANPAGDNPYGIPVTDEDGETEYVSYGPCYYTYDPTTKGFTIPDFSVVVIPDVVGGEPGEKDYNCLKATIIAQYTNVKLTFVEAIELDVPEIAGKWHYTPYYCRNDSTFVKEFDMTLVAKDETNKNLSATFEFEGYDSFTLDATFDGVILTIPFDGLYLDVENKIRFGISASTSTPENAFVKAGQFSFQYNTPTSMWQNDRIYIRQEGTKTEEVEGETVTKETATLVQQLWGGTIVREDPNAIDWSGIYNVEYSIENIEVYEDDMTIPSEFTFEIKKDGMGGYYVSEFMGYDVYSIHYGGFEVTVAADGKSCEIGEGYFGKGLKYSADGSIELGDINGTNADLTLSANEDGTFTLEPISIYYQPNDGDPVFYVLMSNPVITKVVEEEFDWAGTYVLESTVEMEDANAEKYAETFDVEVTFYPETDYMNETYAITSFMGNSVATSANSYGTGIKLFIAEDGKSATIENGYVHSLGAGNYLKMFDKDAMANYISVELNADGTLSMDDFTIVAGAYGATDGNVKKATYKNVTLKKKEAETAIENVAVENNAVEGIFDMQGRQIEEITAPGLYIVNGQKVLVK